MANYQPLLTLVLRMMSMNGFNPLKDTFFNKVLAGTSFILSILYLVWYFIGIQAAWVDINSIIFANLMPGGIVVSIKALALIYYKKRLASTISLIDGLWPIERFEQTHQTSLLKIHKFSCFAVIFFMISAYCASIVAMFTPLIMHIPNVLPIAIFPICDLTTSPCYEILYTYLLLYCYYQFMPIALCFDGLFVALIAYAYVGVEMIKISLHKLDLSTNDEQIALRQISEIVQQHDNVLRLIKETRSIFATPLLGYFLMTSGTETVAFYMLTSDGMPPDLDHVLQYGTYIVIFFVQMLFYCISAAIMEDQIQSIAFEAYNVNWWCKTQPKIRKSLMLIIERSQVDESFTVGNMTKLNLEMFVMVAKNILSIYTLLRETSGKGQSDMPF